jgi:hypothetical protein
MVRRESGNTIATFGTTADAVELDQQVASQASRLTVNAPLLARLRPRTGVVRRRGPIITRPDGRPVPPPTQPPPPPVMEEPATRIAAFVCLATPKAPDPNEALFS